MKISGKYLAWAMIHFSFFLVFVFIDMDVIDFEAEFFTTLGQFVFYFGIWAFFGWRFIKNMELAFK